MLKKKTTAGIPYYYLPLWQESAGVTHGFFTRIGGKSRAPYASLNIGPFSQDDRYHKKENLRSIASVLSLPHQHQIVGARQVHGADIVEVDESHVAQSVFFSKTPLQADGLITNQKGIFLSVVTADCLPVLILDPEKGAVGAVHAGWRGTLQGISGKAVIRMQECFHCRPADLTIALGPAIGACCYQVGPEVAEAFLKKDRNLRPFIKSLSPSQWRIDLAGLNEYQLLKQGLNKKNIFILSLCTHCRQDLFFSVRAQKEPTGRQLSLIGIHRQAIRK